MYIKHFLNLLHNFTRKDSRESLENIYKFIYHILFEQFFFRLTSNLVLQGKRIHVITLVRKHVRRKSRMRVPRDARIYRFLVHLRSNRIYFPTFRSSPGRVTSYVPYRAAEQRGRTTEEVETQTRRARRRREKRRDVHPYSIATLSRVREATGRYPEGVAPAVTLSGPAREINGSP